MPSLSALTSAAFTPRSNSRGSGNSAQAASGSRSASRSPAEAQAAAPSSAEARKAEERPAPGPQAAPVSPPKKLRRSRVPGNLAQIYGESAARRDPGAAPPAQELKKPRRDARARELRRAAMQADGALQRLSQVEAATLIVSEDSQAPTRRGRTWLEACGKCGTRSTFRTAGALCPLCGAICLRDAT